MSFWRRIIDRLKSNEDLSEIKSSSFRDFLNGSILNKRLISKQYKFFILLVLIALFYIDNRYKNEKSKKREVELRAELKDIKYESLSISAELTKLSRRTYILDQIQKKGLDLIESPKPPIVINKPNKKKDKQAILEEQERKKATDRVKRDSTNNDETITHND